MMTVMTAMRDFSRSSKGASDSKSFGVSLSNWLKSPAPKPVKPKMALSEIRLKMELAIQDWHGIEMDRLRHKIRAAATVQDLWLLRGDLHQVISKQTSQQQAADEINALLPCFEGWLPERQLTRI
jgi:hypothetical protein